MGGRVRYGSGGAGEGVMGKAHGVGGVDVRGVLPQHRYVVSAAGMAASSKSSWRHLGFSAITSAALCISSFGFKVGGTSG